MEADHQGLIKKLTKLRVDRSRGTAPHKPLLLLVILELAKARLLSNKSLNLTPELAFRFSVYWSIVAHRRSQPPDVRLPFHHLGSSKLWVPLDAKGARSKHRESTTAIELSEEFFAALQTSRFRTEAGFTLITQYFEPAEQLALFELSGIDPPPNADALKMLAIEAGEDAKAEGRSARFRVDVVAAYCHTCALTGYRISTVTGHSIVDAAHIHQFASSGNDDPQNGIALCKNAHWLFDIGLWSIDDDFCVLVAERAFDEACPTQESLSSMVGKRLILPRDRQLWPSLKNIAWHRRKRFVG